MALDVGPKFKKYLNRGGMILVILGFAGITLGGGDASAAVETASTIVGILGALMVLGRELFN
jgi:hypothetical protein